MLKRSLGIPIGDATRSQKRPIITLVIIALNIIMYAITSYASFFLEISDYWVSAGGFVPSLITMPSQWYRIFSSMFLHADFFHILFNMYFLYLFGRAVENVLGGLRYLALYLISGIAASIFHTTFSFLGGFTAYVIPAIGASGAISGVLGAYLILYPGTSLVMGWFFFIFPVFFRMKAAYYLIFWFATQLIYGYARLAESTAVFAHAGGFLAGIALLLVADKSRIKELRMALHHGFPPYPYLTFTYPKTEGLSKTSKTIVAALTTSLLVGAAYALTIMPNQGDIKAVNIQYTCEGTPYIDFVGVQLPDVASYIAQISQDTTRVLMNRLYAAGLFYNIVYAGQNISLSNWSGMLRIGNVNVPTRIDHFIGRYDDVGFLIYGEGDMTTRVVYLGRALGDEVSYTFALDSETVNLTEVVRYSGVPSLITAAIALFVIVCKDKELTLIGEAKPTGYTFETVL